MLMAVGHLRKYDKSFTLRSKLPILCVLDLAYVELTIAIISLKLTKYLFILYTIIIFCLHSNYDNYLQDTFVGLEALYKYSTLVAGDAMDVNVVITPPGVTFNVDSSNKQILQTSPIDVPNNISISVNGQGCAFVQVYEYSLVFMQEPLSLIN